MSASAAITARPVRVRPVTVARPAAAGAGLSVLAAIAARRGSLPALLDRPGAIDWYDDRLLAGVLPAVAVLAGLAIGRRWPSRWPWLLLGGTLLVLPDLVTAAAPEPAGPPVVLWAGTAAGAPLVLVAVLAGAQELLRDGRVGLGAALAGGTVGAVLVGAALAGFRTAPAVLGVAGLVGAAAAARFGRMDNAADGEPGQPGRAADRWIGGVDAWAAGLVLLPALVRWPPVGELLRLSGEGSRPYPGVAAIGLLTLVAAALVAGAAGRRAAKRRAAGRLAAGRRAAGRFGGGWRAGAVVGGVALVQVGAIGPVLLAFAVVQPAPMVGVGATLAGVVAGLAGCGRATAAALGGVLSTGAVLLVSGPGLAVAWSAVLLALLVATVTATVAATAPVAAGCGGLPVLLGPIAGAMVVGGNQILHGVYRVQDEGRSVEAPVSAGLLALAAAVIAGLAVRRRAPGGRD
jgi:hypothetical protein